eukprot:CAMPEP_0170524146 /NCGR_PEP_ID=MMETSP0209-20121228/9567_1 /TAXON_ID=665100 ORGANISM="Litonotus pictus, Strain P1" /NCGR_SAMPLE_ID=MMETSP0209 /ASSEMBLY_ACC=CAM_ASM_000301 /LENGTH=330 /DNA_ID=CAMNT_0010812645 /DNA_START=1 /DNA_END=990 /DNA_ORIENTATION=+
MMNEDDNHQGPVDILFLYSNPLVDRRTGQDMFFDTRVLDIDKEFSEMVESLYNQKVSIKLVVADNELGLEELCAPKILHISCHGIVKKDEEEEFFLCFEQHGVLVEFTSEILQSYLGLINLKEQDNVSQDGNSYRDSPDYKNQPSNTGQLTKGGIRNTVHGDVNTADINVFNTESTVQLNEDEFSKTMKSNKNDLMHKNTFNPSSEVIFGTNAGNSGVSFGEEGIIESNDTYTKSPVQKQNESLLNNIRAGSGNFVLENTKKQSSLANLNYENGVNPILVTSNHEPNLEEDNEKVTKQSKHLQFDEGHKRAPSFSENGFAEKETITSFNH